MHLSRCDTSLISSEIWAVVLIEHSESNLFSSSSSLFSLLSSLHLPSHFSSFFYSIHVKRFKHIYVYWTKEIKREPVVLLLLVKKRRKREANEFYIEEKIRFHLLSMLFIQHYFNAYIHSFYMNVTYIYLMFSVTNWFRLSAWFYSNLNWSTTRRFYLWWFRSV